MINVVVCDDDQVFRDKVVTLVNKFMHNNELDYKLYEFNDYDSKFIKFIKSDLSNVIYILDIETPTRSGIDIARIIRKYDVESPVIFLTGHQELGSLVLARNTNILSFINKFDNCSNRLREALTTAMKLLNKKHMLRFNDRGSYYSLDCNKILYITTDTVDRKTIIVTDNKEYRVNNTLNYFLDILKSDFVKSHKSCIINKTRVANINNNTSTITFDNGTSIDLLSNKYKKEIDLNGC